MSPARKSAAPSEIEFVTPDYWEDACKHLVKKDRVMRRLIPQFGDARLQSRGDAFTTLARSVVVCATVDGFLGMQCRVPVREGVDAFVELAIVALEPATVVAGS